MTEEWMIFFNKLAKEWICGFSVLFFLFIGFKLLKTIIKD